MNNSSLARILRMYFITYYLVALVTIQVFYMLGFGAARWLNFEDLIFPFLSIIMFFIIIRGHMENSFCKSMVYVCSILMLVVVFFQMKKIGAVAYISWVAFTVAVSYLSLVILYYGS